MKSSLLFLAFLCFMKAVGQQQPIKTYQVGDTIPDCLVKNIINYNKSSVTLSQFRGKVLILDFWSTNCASCIQLIKRNEPIQEKLKEKLQILPITYEDSATVMDKTFRRMKIKAPSVTMDTVLHMMFPHTIVPHYVWVDQAGVIRAITSYREMTEENLRLATEGDFRSMLQKDDFYAEMYAKLNNYRWYEGLLPNMSDSLVNNSLFISRFTLYDPRLNFGQNAATEKGLIFTNVSIKALYTYAYDLNIYDPLDAAGWGGTPPNRYLFQVKDTDFYSGGKSLRDLYCYNLIVPSESKLRPLLRELMKEDLRRVFGLAVSEEVMEVPCYVITCFDKKKLLTAKPDTTNGYMQAKIIDKPFSDLVEMLDRYYYGYQHPVIDDTGIKDRVNISINVKDIYEYYDLQVINQLLSKYGLKMTLKQRKIKMLVLMEPEIPVKKNFTIDVAVPDAVANNEFYLIHAVNGMADTLQTKRPKDGMVQFDGIIQDAPEFHWIKLKGQEKYMTLFLDNADVKIHSSTQSWPQAVISGSSSNAEYEVKVALINGAKNRDSVAKLLIKQQPGSLVSPLLFAYTSWNSAEKLNAYYTLSESVKNSYYGKKFLRELKEQQQREKLIVGNPIPQLFSKNSEDKEINLNDLFAQHKLTLIDFWASWCVPCRKETSNLKKIYNEFHDKGFNIISISLDYNKASWRKAIADDHMDWTHVSQLRGREEEVAKLFGVNGIPAAVLVDQTGKLLAIDLPGSSVTSSGNELRGKALFGIVQKIMNEKN